MLLPLTAPQPAPVPAAQALPARSRMGRVLQN